MSQSLTFFVEPKNLDRLLPPPYVCGPSEGGASGQDVFLGTRRVARLQECREAIEELRSWTELPTEFLDALDGRTAVYVRYADFRDVREYLRELLANLDIETRAHWWTYFDNWWVLDGARTLDVLERNQRWDWRVLPINEFVISDLSGLRRIALVDADDQPMAALLETARTLLADSDVSANEVAAVWHEALFGDRELLGRFRRGTISSDDAIVEFRSAVSGTGAKHNAVVQEATAAVANEYFYVG